MKTTKERIFEIADQMTQNNQNPTLAAVRKELGGGSYTTITEAMTEWRASRQAATAPLREPAPQAISERLDVLGAELWSVALELANSRLKADREALEAARVEMDRQQAEAAELADQLAGEIEQLRAENEKLTFQLGLAETSQKGLEDLLAVERDENTRLKAQAEANADHIKDLHNQLDRAQQENKEQRSKAEVQHREDASEISRLLTALQQTENRLNDLKADREADKKAIEQAAIKQEKADQALEKANQEAKEAVVQAAQLRGELEALKAQVVQQAEMIKQINKQHPKPKNGGKSSEMPEKE